MLTVTVARCSSIQDTRTLTRFTVHELVQGNVIDTRYIGLGLVRLYIYKRPDTFSSNQTGPLFSWQYSLHQDIHEVASTWALAKS